jgi:hypothetical protein
LGRASNTSTPFSDTEKFRIERAEIDTGLSLFVADREANKMAAVRQKGGSMNAMTLRISTLDSGWRAACGRHSKYCTPA